MRNIVAILLLSISTAAYAYHKTPPRFNIDSLSSHIASPVQTKTFQSLESALQQAAFHYPAQKSEFTPAYLQEQFPLDSTANILRLQAQAVIRDLENSQNYVGLITSSDLQTLPIGVKKEINNIPYTLAISKARITPEYAEVTAFVQIVLPQLDTLDQQKQLFFGIDNLKISHAGGIYGDANLVLLGDVAIPINGGNAVVVLKGDFDRDTGDISDLTYVTVDCSGFKELALTAEVLFPRSMLEPVGPDYSPIADESVKVSGFFQTLVSDWNDILVEISLPPFQLTKSGSSDSSGKAGLVFELNTAVFDFSDIRNSLNMDFPPGYQQYLVPGNKQLWRGVYVNTLTVVLPRQFKKRGSEERITLQASGLLIDGMGVSGRFAADDVLSLHEGEASKWQFSVAYLEAELLANNIVGAGFNGRIVLPLTPEVTQAEAQSTNTTAVSRKALSYEALIDPIRDTYSLTVAPQSEVSFEVFRAKATLASNSYVTLEVSENKFKPKAVLYGHLAIAASNDPSDLEEAVVNFKKITFQKLQIQSEAPYLQVDHMGYDGEISFADFPATLSDIEMTANDTEASLHCRLDVNLMEKGFAGQMSLSIIGRFDQGENLHRWRYQTLEIGQIDLNADLGKIQIDGFVDFKDDDPVYGDGFYGELNATFNGITVDATAWFGKTTFRYWYVDAYADLSQSEKKMYIGPTIVNGFGGGAYYRMTKAPGTYSAQVPSGQSYIPDGDSGLGFRALLGFALSNEKAFNGKVGFEMAFNTHGGLNRVLFFGEGHMVKTLDFAFGDKFKQKLKALEDKINSFGANNTIIQKLKATNLVEYSKVAFPQDGLTFDTGIDAHFAMEMDFQNSSFHAQMEVYVNTPGGVFKGIGSRGKAGWAVFHAAPGDWYIHIGTPEDRMGLKVGLGQFRVQAASYLMIGDNLPGSPPPPAIVAEILGVDMQKLDYMRDLNALSDGRGFAFGSSFSVDTGNINFLIFYARFQAGLGYDIMVKDYGETACHGRGQIGIDGWYANGQAYAYLQGELGIRIKLLFVRKRIPIIRAGAAVLLQAKLPNPAWFRGYLGGHYRVLGGLVKGRFRFKIELGKQCKVVGGAPLGGLKIISSIKPDDSATNMDVFTVPQAAFNMRINTPFELEDDQGVKTYRILLDEYTVTQEGVPLAGHLEWNENNDVVNFVSFDALPPNAAIRIKVAVSFQQQQGGSWVTLTQDGQPAKETEERSFTTGEAPDYIPHTNIAYSYPVVDQDYFYKDERSTGYLQLNRGQPYLFAPQTDWTQAVRFESDLGIASGSNLSYDVAKRTVHFTLPPLQNQQAYTLRLVSRPPGQEDSGDVDTDTYTSLDTGQEDTTIEVRNQQAQNILNDQVLAEMLTYDFTTSQYNTFAQKVQDKRATQHYLEPIYSDVHALQADVQPSERFSLQELLGSRYTAAKPLVTREAVLDDAYYTQTIYPLLYQQYPLEPAFTVNRPISALGLPPKKAVDILTWYPTHLENNPSYSLLNTRIPYRYHLPFYYKQDFIDIQYKIVNTYLQNPVQYQSKLQQYDYIINGVFPALPSGDYNIKLQYVLPGDIEGSSVIFTYTNPF